MLQSESQYYERDFVNEKNVIWTCDRLLPLEVLCKPEMAGDCRTVILAMGEFCGVKGKS